MALHKKIVFPWVAALTAVFAAGSARAARIPRIELLRQVQVSGAHLLLSDLLPGGARDSLRARAANISLGSAPQFGATRTLYRDAVLQRLNEGPEILSEITVPERIVISRESRPITVSEVLVAIGAALEHERRGCRRRALRPESVLLQSQVLVSPGDAGLQVVRMSVDASLRRARFLLWPARDPTVLPFIVTAQFDGDVALPSLPSAELQRPSAHSELPVTPKPLPSREILVSPGEQAAMVFDSGSFRMYADVAPLERGSMGQQIRVRVLETGKYSPRKWMDGPTLR